jgi:hypothetical protein
MPTFELPTDNERIAADLKATFEASNATMTSKLNALFNSPPPAKPPETSNLGRTNIGLFRERLRTPISNADRSGKGGA